MTISNEFFTPEEKEDSREFQKNGYIIRPVENMELLDWVRSKFVTLAKKKLDIDKSTKDSEVLDLVHTKLSVNQLNDFRLSMINEINSIVGFRAKYYQISRKYLNTIVGNELAMQLRVNLSIQLPQDDSSLLQTHADTWSGVSPFEVVVWIPLVDCYKTKSMYILPPDKNAKLNKNFNQMSGNSSEDLFKSIEPDVKWIDIKYGEIMLFNQSLPHGNRVNIESDTRWSMNCRFKGLFTPYCDKKIGEFYEPITLRTASITGLNYQHPKLQ